MSTLRRASFAPLLGSLFLSIPACQLVFGVGDPAELPAGMCLDPATHEVKPCPDAGTGGTGGSTTVSTSSGGSGGSGGTTSTTSSMTGGTGGTTSGTTSSSSSSSTTVSTGGTGGTGGSGGTGGAPVCTQGETKPCYTGPLASQNKGNCKDGTSACLPDGTGFGSCAGEIVPDPLGEDCAKLGDEDCDGVACSDPVWASLFGDNSDQRVTSMAVDVDGNIVVAGVFQGFATFGGSTLMSAGNNDYFVAKLAPSGAVLWARRYGDTTNNGVNISVATDAMGKVIVAGEVSGFLDFGACGMISNNAHPAATVFVAKLSSAGACEWAKSFGNGAGQGQYANSVDTDSLGNIFVAGRMDGTLQFSGTAPLLSVKTAGYPDVFLAKLGADGSHVWSKKFFDSTGTAPTSSRSIKATVDRSTGSVYVGGTFTGKLVIDTKTLTFTGLGSAIYAAGLDNNGSAIVAKAYGGQQGFGAVLGLTAVNNVVALAGQMADPIDFGGGPLMLQGQYDGFVATFDANLVHHWSMRFGDPNDATGSNVDTGTAVAFDKDANVLLAGYAYGQLAFGTGPTLTAQGGTDVFLAKLSPTGSHIWSKLLGDTANQVPAGVGSDPITGNVILAGSSQGSIDFGTGPKMSMGAFDAFVATFQP